MDKTLYIGIATLALVSSTAMAHEQDDQAWRNTVWSGFGGFLQPDWKQDFSATVGVKVWMNEWRRDQFIIDTAVGSGGIVGVSFNGAPRGQTSDTEATPIPQLSVRYKWLIASASYYAETDFDFPTTTGLTALVNSGTSTSTLAAFDSKLTGARYEWDVAGGFYIHPNIVILGGYKQMRQTLNFSSTYNAALSNGGDAVSNAVNRQLSFQSDGKFDVSGPTIGIAASVPMGQGFGVYGNYAHGFLTLADGTADLVVNPAFSGQVTPFTNFLRGEKDVAYDVAELGITYTYGLNNLPAHLPLSAATAYLGYRYQAFETDLSGGGRGFTERSDKTQGFVAGVNFNF
jgi:hypothetical protein